MSCLREDLFDWIEIKVVGRQENSLASGPADGLSHWLLLCVSQDFRPASRAGSGASLTLNPRRRPFPRPGWASEAGGKALRRSGIKLGCEPTARTANSIRCPHFPAGCGLVRPHDRTVGYLHGGVGHLAFWQGLPALCSRCWLPSSGDTDGGSNSICRTWPAGARLTAPFFLSRVILVKNSKFYFRPVWHYSRHKHHNINRISCTPPVVLPAILAILYLSPSYGDLTTWLGGLRPLCPRGSRGAFLACNRACPLVWGHAFLLPIARTRGRERCVS